MSISLKESGKKKKKRETKWEKKKVKIKKNQQTNFGNCICQNKWHKIAVMFSGTEK